MSFLDESHMDYLNYLFMSRTLTYGSTSRPIIEAGPQVLMLKDVNIRPLSPFKCIYTFEIIKDHPTIKYIPIIKTYEVIITQGKVNNDGFRMMNFLQLSFNMIISFEKSNFIKIYTDTITCKKKSFNAVIAYNRELIVSKGKIVIDDSYLAVKIFGYTTFKSLFSSYIILIKMIDDPIYSTDYDVRSLMADYTEKDQFLINKFS